MCLLFLNYENKLKVNNSLCSKRWNYISSVSPKIDNCELFFVICESRYISLDNISVYSLFMGLYPLYKIYIGCNTYFQWLINQPKYRVIVCIL